MEDKKVEVIAFMSLDFDGEVDGEGRILDIGTRGWCFTLPLQHMVHDNVVNTEGIQVFIKERDEDDSIQVDTRDRVSYVN